MANPRHFAAVVSSFLLVLTSGASVPANADPDFDDFSALPPLELVAVPPPIDEFERSRAPEPSGIEITISAPETPPPPAPPVPVAGLDPWAEAFAESARLQTRAPVPPEPVPYVVATNRRVGYFLERFTGSRREVVAQWFGRSGRYLGMIREVLRRHGLPEDLAYTAMIESGFDPLAVSRAGATGLWQFMASTARRYGLRVDRWADERFDPERATVAAAAYLRDLHLQFGSWLLAQAAYNAGEMAVARAVQRTGSTDFWAIASTAQLSQETKDFVPAIQAATLLGRDPVRYGFDVGGSADPNTVRVTVPPATNLRQLARAAGISADTLQALNPVLVRGVTPPGASWQLRIPRDRRDRVLAALAPRPPTRLAQRRASAPERVGAPSRASIAAAVHVVRSNDTVTAIARRYGVSITDLVRWNGLDVPDRIHPGDRLRVADLR